MNSMSGGRGPTGSMKENIPKGYKKGTLNNFTPEQMQLFRQSFSDVGPDSYLSRLAGGDQSMFEEMEAPAFRQFNELQGNISSRFSGMGGTGSRRSSGFQNTMNSAGSNFAQDLASRRQSLQQNAIKELAGLRSELLGQKPQENFLVEKQQKEKKGGWGGLAGAALGGTAGFFAGGPTGAMAGAKLGHSIGSSF